MAILQEKFIHRTKQVDELIKDPKVSAADKISAHHLGAEFDTAVFKLAMETPYHIIDRRRRLKQNQDELSLSLSASSSSLPLPSSQGEAFRLQYEKAMMKNNNNKKEEDEKEKEEENDDELDDYTAATNLREN